MDFVVAALIFYLAFKNVFLLKSVALSAWGLEQYLLLAVTLLLAAAGIFKVKRGIAVYKGQEDESGEEETEEEVSE